MDLTQLANLGEFIGGVAVLVTLVYLAAQVRQSNTWNKQQGFRDGQGRIVDWVEHVTATKEIAHLYNSGSTRYQDLDEDDRFRFDLIQAQRWGAFELIWDYHRGGSVKDELLEIIERAMRLDLAKSGVRLWWVDAGRKIFATDFRDFADDMFEKAGEDLGS